MAVQGKQKADRNRARVEENFLKQTHSQRQEAAQTRREDKKRAEKERIMNEEDPERQRRLEVCVCTVLSLCHYLHRYVIFSSLFHSGSRSTSRPEEAGEEADENEADQSESHVRDTFIVFRERIYYFHTC